MLLHETATDICINCVTVVRNAVGLKISTKYINIIKLLNCLHYFI